MRRVGIFAIQIFALLGIVFPTEININQRRFHRDQAVQIKTVLGYFHSTSTIFCASQCTREPLCVAFCVKNSFQFPKGIVCEILTEIEDRKKDNDTRCNIYTYNSYDFKQTSATTSAEGSEIPKTEAVNSITTFKPEEQTVTTEVTSSLRTDNTEGSPYLRTEYNSKDANEEPETLPTESYEDEKGESTTSLLTESYEDTTKGSETLSSDTNNQDVTEETTILTTQSKEDATSTSLRPEENNEATEESTNSVVLLENNEDTTKEGSTTLLTVSNTDATEESANLITDENTAATEDPATTLRLDNTGSTEESTSLETESKVNEVTTDEPGTSATEGNKETTEKPTTESETEEPASSRRTDKSEGTSEKPGSSVTETEKETTSQATTSTTTTTSEEETPGPAASPCSMVVRGAIHCTTGKVDGKTINGYEIGSRSALDGDNCLCTTCGNEQTCMSATYEKPTGQCRLLKIKQSDVNFLGEQVSNKDFDLYYLKC